MALTEMYRVQRTASTECFAVKKAKILHTTKVVILKTVCRSHNIIQLENRACFVSRPEVVYEATKPGFSFFVFILCCSNFVFRMIVCFCCVRFVSLKPNSITLVGSELV